MAHAQHRRNDRAPHPCRLRSTANRIVLRSGLNIRCARQLLHRRRRVVDVHNIVMQACAERIKSDKTGQAHCSGQYFDFWHCVDHCVSPGRTWGHMGCMAQARMDAYLSCSSSTDMLQHKPFIRTCHKSMIPFACRLHPRSLPT